MVFNLIGFIENNHVLILNRQGSCLLLDNVRQLKNIDILYPRYIIYAYASKFRRQVMEKQRPKINSTLTSL